MNSIIGTCCYCHLPIYAGEYHQRIQFKEKRLAHRNFCMYFEALSKEIEKRDAEIVKLVEQVRRFEEFCSAFRDWPWEGKKEG